MNQSEKIRRMYLKNDLTMGQISKKLGIRYQTVWRTLNRKFKNEIPVEVKERMKAGK